MSRRSKVLLNLFQVRLRAREGPEGHEAQGTVRAEPEEIHPGDEVTVVVEIGFPEGGPPGGIDVKVSPPDDFHLDEPTVDLREDGATVTIVARAEDEVELGSYYVQVVYSDDAREHFEAEAPLEIKRHWVRIGEVVASPSRASPGDPVDLSVSMGFEGQARVRGHVRGRLVPEGWDGSDEESIKLPRERTSVSDTRDQTWHVRLPRSARHGKYHADIEFSSGEGTARRRAREVLLLVPERGIHADSPEVSPRLLAPGDELTISTRTENVGLEDLLVRVGGDLVPGAGGTPLPLEEHDVPLAPGEARDVGWNVSAPQRTGRWAVRLRARAERTEGADPREVLVDVRPPNQVHVVGAVPSRPWAAPGETVEVALQLMDEGSRPGHDASVEVALMGEAGESSTARWSGWLGTEEVEVRVSLEVPHPPEGSGEGDQPSARYTLMVRGHQGEELLRVPGAVATRRRVAIEPRLLKAQPDPTRLGDSLLPGERVLRTADATETTLVELSSGCRIYARGDLVAGVDEELPLDDDFWVDALDADLRLYTELKEGLQLAARTAEAESLAMRDSMTSVAGAKASSAEGIVKDGRRLVTTFDPDHPPRRVEPRKGPLAPLAAWLSDRGAPAGKGREIVAELRRYLAARAQQPPGEGAGATAVAAATAAADHLEAMAELMARAWDQDRFDSRTLKAVVALVAATAVSQVEFLRTRETDDPWVWPLMLSEASKAAIRSNMAQLATLVELVARHRVRKKAAIANMRQRAAHAAVARDLEVEAPVVVGHSGDAASIHVSLRNGSHVALDLRLNVALPTSAWTVLEPQARGGQGLMFVGPVHVEARSEGRVDLVLYVPTTVHLDSYTVPIEVVPEPRDVMQEQGVVVR